MINEKTTLNSFISDYSNLIESKIISQLDPVNKDINDIDKNLIKKLSSFTKCPKGAQIDKIITYVKAFREFKYNGLLLQGEQGTGKTLMGIIIAKESNFKRIITVVPTHLINKWIKEIKDIYNDSVDIIDLNNQSLSDLISLKYKEKPSRTEFYILGKERAKLHYYEKPVFNTKKAKDKEGHIIEKIYCPDCGADIELAVSKLKNKRDRKIPVKGKFKCPACNSQLSTSDGKIKRFAKSIYIKKHLKNIFDLAIFDEIHEYNNKNSVQGRAFSDICAAAKHQLGLTGTLMGGYASNLYHIAWRILPYEMSEICGKFGGLTSFVDEYGVTELGAGNMKKEKPGISPLIVPHLILPKTSFIKLEDFDDLDMPSYNEEIVTIKMDDEMGYQYKKLEESLKDTVREALTNNDHHVLGKMISSLLLYPDTAKRDMNIYNNDDILISKANAVHNNILQKDIYLIDEIAENIKKDRKVMIYLDNTGKHDITEDLQNILKEYNYTSYSLKSNIKSRDREKFIIDNYKNYDVLFTNPRLVKTGLDLVMYPTIIFYQPGNSVFTTRQASRRSWRIGQDKEVKILFYIYEDTIQEKYLKVIAQKMEISTAIEGDFDNKGLASIAESESSIILELARNLINSNNDNRTLADLWNNANKKEKESKTKIGSSSEILVDYISSSGMSKDYIFKNGKIILKVTGENVGKFDKSGSGNIGTQIIKIKRKNNVFAFYYVL